MADVALLDEVGDGADRLLDRHVRVEARGAVDVDDVDAEALQRVGGEVLHRGGAAIDAEPRAVRAAQRAELHGDLHLVAAARDGAADEQLVVAHAVEVAGVEERDAALDALRGWS